MKMTLTIVDIITLGAALVLFDIVLFVSLPETWKAIRVRKWGDAAIATALSVAMAGIGWLILWSYKYRLH